MPSFDRTGMLNEIKAGYYRSAMSGRPDPDPKTLEREQDDRARAEERFARSSQQPAEQRAHLRRADKAAYLRDKLAEAEQADREDG
jgi:hypothetical protein